MAASALLRRRSQPLPPPPPPQLCSGPHAGASGDSPIAAWGTGATPLAEDVQVALAQQAARQRPQQQRRHSGTVRSVAAAAAAAAAAVAGSDDDGDDDYDNHGCGRVGEASFTSAVIDCDLLAAVRDLQAERQQRQPPQQHPQPAAFATAAATTAALASSFPTSLPPDTAVSALDVIREVGFIAPCLSELRVLGRCASSSTSSSSSFCPPPTATDAAGDVLEPPPPPPPPPPAAERRRGTVVSVPSLRDLDLCGAARRTLRVLCCAGVGLRRLEGLSALPLLEELYLPFNAVDDASPAACLDHLAVLDLEGNRVPSLASVQTLRECGRLRHLTLAGCPVASAEGYRGDVAHLLPQLASLDELPGEALALAALATSEQQVLSRGTHPEPRACDVAPLLDFVDGGGATEAGGGWGCDGDALSGLLEALSPTVDAALVYARLRDGGGGGGDGGGCASAASALMHARGSRGLFCGGTLLRRASSAAVGLKEEEEEEEEHGRDGREGEASLSQAAASDAAASNKRVRSGVAGDVGVAFRKTRAGLRRGRLRAADEVVATPEGVGEAAVVVAAAATMPALDVIDVVDAY